MTLVNVGCGPHRAPAPWVNVDCHVNEEIRPDVLVDPDHPLDVFRSGSVERVYLGHVLEHIPWPDVVPFLVKLREALPRGGRVCVVGPDVLRVIQRWKDGLDPEGWLLVESVLEGPWDRDLVEAYELLRDHEPSWDRARHWWNCYESRVAYAVQRAGFADVIKLPITPAALEGWPVVAYTQWQCAVEGVK